LYGVEPRGPFFTEHTRRDRFDHRTIIVAVVAPARTVFGDLSEIGEGREN
jgi:hypothetical protein